jgi:hypothetical protein
VSSSQRDRRGISLLEIMISIGIVGIGLIGVASLIPLAHYKAEQGVREERKALFGKRAYREFFVSGFDRPGSFLATGQGTPFWVWLTPQTPYGIYNGMTGQIIPQTYCFDPHWVAAKIPQAVTIAALFPALGPPAAQVPRITVLTYRPETFRESLLIQGATPALASNRMAAFVNNSNPARISLAQADQVFRIHDDLLVESPNSPSGVAPQVGVNILARPDLPNDIARQTYLSESFGAYAQPVGVKRLSGGNFSWMATLVPELNSVINPSNPNAIAPYVTNRYRLSIVIFNQRDLLGNYNEEVVAQVQLPPDSMISGAAKEIVIVEVGPNPPVAENVGVRHIRQGDWIALMQKVPMPPPLGVYTRLQWYQVLSTDEQDADTTMVRQLSLSGPDWNPDWSQPIFAIYLRNVETVYEKTVELQQ